MVTSGGRIAQWRAVRSCAACAVGSILTATPGTWTGRTSYRYEWYDDGRTIKGATKSSLTLSNSRMDGRSP